jgi:hypothetical protein
LFNRLLERSLPKIIQKVVAWWGIGVGCPGENETRESDSRVLKESKMLRSSK